MCAVKGFVLVSICVVSLCSTAGIASAAAPNACPLPAPPHSAFHASIFNPQQEQWLGEAEADAVEPDLVLAPESANTYIARIGQSLVRALPPSPTQYSFQIFESDLPESFALAGGRIYLSRKLLLDAQSEDEVAAMLAHEIGRAYIHHSASLVTLRFEKLLNVRSVDTQADIEDKLGGMLNVPQTDSSEPKPDNRDKDEMLSDRVALWALINAGYVPEALATFLDRSGGDHDPELDTIAQLFDFESDPNVRGAQAHKVSSELPAPCLNTRPQFRPGFKAFQQALINSQIDPTLPPSPGLNPITLTPPMNPALLNVRLSPDAKYVLAQDESRIHVLSTNPTKLLFSIDATGAKMAQFTPDSKSVVFAYSGLRVEDWDVASQKRVGLLDWVDYDGCNDSGLSPDGVSFACFTLNEQRRWFKVSDLSSGRVIYQDTIFPSATSDWQTMPAIVSRWSQDGHYFLYATNNLNLILDLKSGKPITFEGPAGIPLRNRIEFVDSNHLLFGCGEDIFASSPKSKMCYAAAPMGDILDRFSLDETLWMAPVTRGPHVLVGPFDGISARVLDPATGNLGEKFKLETVDLSGDTVAYEIQPGGLSVGKLDGPAQTSPLPVTPIKSFEAAAFSANGHYLALSDRARGAVWDLTTGNRLKVTHPFREASFDKNGALQAVEVNQELKPAGNGTIDRETGKMAWNFSIGATAVQFGDVIVEVKPRSADAIVKDVELNASDAATRKVLWTRHFGEGMPRVRLADGGRMLLTMPWSSDAAKQELRVYKDLLIQTSDAKKKGDDMELLVEVVNNKTGLTERLIRAPAFEPENVLSAYVALYGDLLTVKGAFNNSTIYRESNGARLFSLFGTILAVDNSLGLIAARDRAQELTLYNTANGNRLGDLTMDSPILAARIIAEKKQLLVLTALEHVYKIDLAETLKAAPAR
jgi:hypothetical protein